jgi:hypothetical protein
MRSAAGVVESWSGDDGSSPRFGLGAVALLFLGGLLTLSLIGFSAVQELLAWDLRYAYLPAAEAVLDGISPYPALDDPILEDQKGYVYPPQLVVALLPLAWVPVEVAAALTTLLMLICLGLTLRVLGVRDVRCYAAVLLWVPTVGGYLFSNLSIPLALALAVMWRYRDVVWPPAIALGLAVSAKLLLWPLFVWTVMTRRMRATLLAIVVGVAVTLGAWAAIGFDGLQGYPDLLRRLSEIQAENSYSFVGMAATLGLGETVGQVLTFVLGGALLVWCAVLARAGDDFRSFTCAVAATLALSPIVWLHYLVALMVPLAIARPRFSALWLLPIVLWVSPKPGYAEGFQTFAPAVVTAILLAVLLARPAQRAAAAAASAA